jgi:spoIIIJ-associated protein
MNQKFLARTLEEAYGLASENLKVSIINLNVEVIQKPQSGFFGFFQKDAIILASVVDENNDDIKDTLIKEYNTLEISMLEDIKTKINLLFNNLCFEINEINVSIYDKNTILIELNGNDAPLLIGKDGYRYKALSYLLFNWINDKYSMMTRLEIAQFLKSQEESTILYLEPIIKNIKTNNTAKTKPLDGVIIHIALKILRDEFPKKYVAIKTNTKGDKYVFVSEYKK